ncbi:MAG: hypothetical protein PHV74_06755 [Dehalococcoidia bacterium]|nr:hypothetical protein [Dehalococcoidia bacterium]
MSHLLHRCGVAALLVLLFWAVFPSAVFADPATPDNLQIRDVKVFRHLIEEDDFLAVVAFDIGYDASPPSEPANTYFLFRFVDSDGNDIGQQVPYSYGFNGYYYGITAFYFSADNVPAWDAAHQVKLEGNPTQWTTLPTPSIWTIGSSDYSAGTDQLENRAELETWLVTAILDLEVDWGVPAALLATTTGGLVLTAEGQYYMVGAIPGLSYFAPDIFMLNSATIGYPDDTEWSDRATDVEASYADTPIETLKNTLGDMLGGINPVVATTLLVMVGILVLMGLAFFKWQSTEASYAVIPVALLYAAKITFLPWALFGLFAFVAVLYIGWMLLGKYG